jgi:hypothetical protein
MDSPNTPLTLQGLLRFTASIAAEFYVGRAGEPVPTGGGRQRAYNVEDAVNEAAAILTFALSPELAGRAFERAASLYGAASLLAALQPQAHSGQQNGPPTTNPAHSPTGTGTTGSMSKFEPKPTPHVVESEF